MPRLCAAINLLFVAANLFWGTWAEDADSCLASGDCDDTQLLQIRASPYESCYMADSDCSLESMNGKPTLVYPGGLTSCINGDDYAFAVVPGALDKVLYYFAGGGACWEAESQYGPVVVERCTQTRAEAIRVSGIGGGVQDNIKDENPFKGYTTVEPLYCGGGAFVANTTLQGQAGPLVMNSYNNAKAVKDWMQANYKQKLESFVIMGYSAGSLGTALWANDLLDSFEYETASVILDSYAAIFPEGTTGATVKSWGACQIPIWDEEIQAKCEAGKITVQEVFAQAMQRHPDVAFASIQSKVDKAQIWFYTGMAQSHSMVNESQASGARFYKETNDAFEGYNKFPNYVSYLVDGGQHCFTQSPQFFMASTAGTGQPAPEGSLMLAEWVSKVVAHEPVTSECNGAVVPNEGTDETYCDEAMAGKVLKVAK